MSGSPQAARAAPQLPRKAMGLGSRSFGDNQEQEVSEELSASLTTVYIPRGEIPFSGIL